MYTLEIQTDKMRGAPPMEMNICEAACDCCTSAKIYASINEHDDKWKEMEGKKVAHTPLHKAAAAGKTEVAVEILCLMPSLGRKLNEEGLSPLHLAVERGWCETVRGMVRFERSLVRVKGKEGETPLMVCAAKADNPKYKKLLASLLLACPQSVEDVNNKCETVVQVALRKNNCQAVCILVDWLKRRGQIASVLSPRDVYGDTVLHAAARFGCVEGARRLVNLVKVNRVNYEGKTALDIANQCGQVEVARLLKERRAKKATDIISTVLTTTDYVLTPPIFAEAISRTYFYLTKQLTLDMRAAILVVATVILTATYQGVMQPPGGLYPAPEMNTTATISHRMRRLDEEEQHLAGQMVMRESYYYIFMPSNTFAFALSAVIIIFVVPGSPIFLILHLCLLFLCISYLLALDAISYYTGFSKMLFYMSLYAIIGAYIIKVCYYPVKALLVEQDWWLRRVISVRFSNWSSSSGWGSTRLARTAEKMKMQNRVLTLNH